MESLFYLGKVGLLYAGLYLIYFLLFRNNTYFQLNRFYLLLIIPIAFILPAVNLNPEVIESYHISLPVFEVNNLVAQELKINWEGFFVSFYLTITLFMFVLFLYRIGKIVTTIHKIKSGKRDTNLLPFSFFSFIHVPENIEEEDRVAIYFHEQVHVDEFHSLDIIIYEITKILIWWNPFVWMGLNAVKTNHEYIADKLASEKADKYSSVLVAQLLGVNCSELVNNFKSQLLIKKRIMMMKTKKSNRLSVLKYALVIPVVALAMVTTTENVLAEKTTSNYQKGDEKVYDKVDVMPEFEGGMDALVKYLQENIKYPATAKKDGNQGKVLVAFIVNSKGEVKEAKVVQGVNDLLDQEAKRVVEEMPNWKPGEKDGKKVSVKYTIPIVFQL